MSQAIEPLAVHDAQPADQARKAQEKGILYLGVDLGTSRTSIAASNGVRATVSSWVGYPKDVVARKALQKDVLFGDDALAQRTALDLYRPLAAGVIQLDAAGDGERKRTHLQAAKDLLRHAVSLARPRPDELIYAVIGCPAECSIKNKSALIEAARPVASSVMVVSEPFSVAYGLDLLSDCLVIDIGAGTTDLCRMHGTIPGSEDQATSTFAGDHVDRTLEALLRAKHPEASLSIHAIKEIKERASNVLDQHQPVFVDLPVNGKPARFEIGAEMREACRSIVPSMVDGIHRLIASYDPDFQSRLKQRVVLGGGGSQMGGLRELLEAEMKDRLGEGRVTRVDEPTYGGANGALKIAHDMPPEFWEKLD